VLSTDIDNLIKLAEVGAVDDVKASNEFVSPIDINSLKTGIAFVGGLANSHLNSIIGVGDIPIATGHSKPFIIGGAIPVASGISGAAVGSAIATPIILKSIAFPSLAAAKTATLISAFPLFADSVKSKFNVAANKAVNKGTVGVLFGANLLKKGAIGLAVKGAQAVKKGTAVFKNGAITAGHLILKPVSIVAGSKLKLLGGGVTLLGKGVKLTGTALRKVGTGLKMGGLGGIGIGATAIGWGFDKSTVENQLAEDIKFINGLSLFNLPLLAKKALIV